MVVPERGGNQYGAFPTVFADAAYAKLFTSEEKTEQLEEVETKKRRAKEVNVVLKVESIDNPPDTDLYQMYLDHQAQSKSISTVNGFGNTALVV